MRSVFFFPLGQIRAACEHKPQETELHWESGFPQQAARMPPPARHSVCLRSECAALEKSPGPCLPASLLKLDLIGITQGWRREH